MTINLRKKTKIISTLVMVVSLSFWSSPAHTDNNSNAYLQAGHEESHKGNFDKAIENYEKALKIDPTNEAAKNSLRSSQSEKNIAEFTKSLPVQCQHRTDDLKTQLECAKKYFTIQGKPISPQIVKDLVTWISDGGDQVVSIDLIGSQGSNRYFDEGVLVKKFGKFFTVEGNTTLAPKEGFFTYSVEGMTDNGVFILSTSENGGGSGVFETLLLVRIIEGKGFDLKERGLHNFKKSSAPVTLSKTRILIEKLGSVPLGDRSSFTIKIQGNTINIDLTEFPSGKKNHIIFTLDNN